MRVSPRLIVTSSRIAVGGRFSVGLVDADADVGGVALAAVDDRVEEHVVAGDGGQEEELAVVGQRDLVERVRVAGASTTSWGSPATVSGSLSGSASFFSTLSVTGMPTTVDAESLTARGSLFDVSSRIATRTVPFAVAPNESTIWYCSSIVPAWLAGSGVKLTSPDGSKITRPLGTSTSLEHERVAVGVGVVVQHVERRGRAAAHLGDVGLGDRRAIRRVVAHDLDRRRSASAVAPRPSLTVYEKSMLPVNPGGGTTWTDP